jgi:hypothetical protein
MPLGTLGDYARGAVVAQKKVGISTMGPKVPDIRKRALWRERPQEASDELLEIWVVPGADDKYEEEGRTL